uniref:hypothetical protein n=1 Tax=Kineococcus sp. SYSU DK018 TaxID=3383139 RepID=UPI003D7D9E94
VRADNAPSPASVTVTIAAGSDGGGITVSVARAEGLTLDQYLETNWFRGTATTVSGRPALANSIRSDDAAGLVWSPADGVVIEAHAASDRAQELRELVENMHLK